MLYRLIEDSKRAPKQTLANDSDHTTTMKQSAASAANTNSSDKDKHAND